MEELSTGRLKDMMLAAQFIDNGLEELEKVFLSVDSLLADETNMDKARTIANEVRQEVTELEENIKEIKIHMESVLQVTILENEKADAAIQSMKEGISQIEETLKHYGYDSSTMPTAVPSIVIYDTDDSTCSEDNEISLEGKEENGLATPSPLKHKELMLSESLSYESGEITPLVLSSKFVPRSFSSADSPQLTPYSNGFPIPVKDLSPSKYAGRSEPHLQTVRNNQAFLEKQGLSVETKKVLEKPTLPIFSKTTYDLLGEEPPPEFYGRVQTS